MGNSNSTPESNFTEIQKLKNILATNTESFNGGAGGGGGAVRIPPPLVESATYIRVTNNEGGKVLHDYNGNILNLNTVANGGYKLVPLSDYNKLIDIRSNLTHFIHEIQHLDRKIRELQTMTPDDPWIAEMLLATCQNNPATVDALVTKLLECFTD